MTTDVQLTSTQNSYTHQWLQAIIIIDVAFYQAITVVIIRYVVCGQVQIASNLILEAICTCPHTCTTHIL